ncbi:hypothetical protein DFA_01680 [Cavenderia fasciculata]|uniref:Vacuolar import and degradation protein n=1 Tax=Cavenderia fasciculata TaxID=261658 RepID=F4PU79_CACFS|nr:uncharacterized protein DFA_01680 [Cavenderia fasciculata]EGG21794.1 hypothetical protein DFA_01680 [Cavenderia fasciculata]|eukprot:XP_004359644.1 hypothetical protein DFA_01680 [Cavenderia fasciculata]
MNELIWIYPFLPPDLWFIHIYEEAKLGEVTLPFNFKVNDMFNYKLAHRRSSNILCNCRIDNTRIYKLYSSINRLLIILHTTSQKVGASKESDTQKSEEEAHFLISRVVLVLAIDNTQQQEEPTVAGEQTTRYRSNDSSVPGGCASLYPGSRFVGVQRSAKASYPVHIDIKDVDFDNSILSGYLTILGLTKKYPVLTTFFEGEIVDGKHYGFLTRKWEANAKVDLDHWGRFPEFQTYADSFNRDDFESSLLKSSDTLFMRWKESFFLVPDHRIKNIEGASYEGFYYIALERATGTIRGFYYHCSSELFQTIILEHETESSFPCFEFR